MYISPIELILSDIQMKTEEHIVKAVQRVGVNVDKEELVKALKYDREQYEKGYADGKAYAHQWVYVKDRLPETVLNFHTQDYQEYICLCDFGRYGYDVRTYKFGDGHFWNGGHDIDRYVIAWQPLPEVPDTLRLNYQDGGMDD